MLRAGLLVALAACTGHRDIYVKAGASRLEVVVYSSACSCGDMPALGSCAGDGDSGRPCDCPADECGNTQDIDASGALLLPKCDKGVRIPLPTSYPQIVETGSGGGMLTWSLPDPVGAVDAITVDVGDLLVGKLCTVPITTTSYPFASNEAIEVTAFGPRVDLDTETGEVHVRAMTVISAGTAQ